MERKRSSVPPFSDRLLGAAVSAGIAAWYGEGWGEIGRAAAKGFVVGGVSGLTLGLAGPWTAGLLGGGIGGGVLSGAVASGIGDAAGQTFEYLLGWRCKLSLRELGYSAAYGGAFGGFALRPYVAPNQPVVSWASKGVTPDLASGRWVMTGGPSLRNWLLKGQWQYPRGNYASGNLNGSNLQWPSGTETLKGYFGQRQIK